MMFHQRSVAAAIAVLCVWTANVEAARPPVKTYTALTRPLELEQGEVTNSFHRLPIPRGPIAVYRFAAEVVEKDAEGNIIPTASYDAYLHHHVVGSDHSSYAKEQGKWAPMKPNNFSRSVGFGAGTECRGTPQEFYYPYAFMTAPGEDDWIANVHVINTRRMATPAAHHCLECPCTSEDEITAGNVNGMPLTGKACNAELLYENNTACFAETYYGGLHCCKDGEYCLESEELSKKEKSTYYLQYTIEYADVVPENRPLYLASCCDASGTQEHHGNIEYDIPLCDPAIHPGCVHTLSTRQPINLGGTSVFGFGQAGKEQEDREVDLVYAVGHQHRGGLGIQMYNDQTGELLCSSVPEYGNGHEAGNEAGYVVAMSTCTFDPPVRLRVSDLVRIAALYNNTEAHTGVMSLMYLAITDVPSSSSSVRTSHAVVPGSAQWHVGTIAGAMVALGAVVSLVVLGVKRLKKRRGYTPLEVNQ